MSGLTRESESLIRFIFFLRVIKSFIHHIESGHQYIRAHTHKHTTCNASINVDLIRCRFLLLSLTMFMVHFLDVAAIISVDWWQNGILLLFMVMLLAVIASLIQLIRLHLMPHSTHCNHFWKWCGLVYHIKRGQRTWYEKKKWNQLFIMLTFHNCTACGNVSEYERLCTNSIRNSVVEFRKQILFFVQ